MSVPQEGKIDTVRKIGFAAPSGCGFRRNLEDLCVAVMGWMILIGLVGCLLQAVVSTKLLQAEPMVFGSAVTATLDTTHVVVAASSLTDVLPHVLGMEATIAYAGSNTLRMQLDQGLDAALFFSADSGLAARTRRAGAVVHVASNDLVVAYRPEFLHHAVLESAAGPDDVALASQLVAHGARWAIAAREVPAGRYAAAWLRTLPTWLQEEIGRQTAAQDLSARATLRRLDDGEVDAAVVYRTDVLGNPALRFGFISLPAHQRPGIWATVIDGSPHGERLLKQALTSNGVWSTFGFRAPDSLAWQQTSSVAPSGSGDRPSPVFGSAIADALWRSIWTAFLAALLCGALGLPLARWLAARPSGVLGLWVDLPMFLPPSVAGLLLIVVLGPENGLAGWLGGSPILFTPMAIILAQTFVSLPLFVRSVEASLRGIDQDFIEAAYLDGAGRWDVFRSIELPLAWPGVVAGLTLAWARSIGEFGATLFVGGNVPGRTQTGATLIMTLMEGQLSDALWLAAALAGISALSLGAWHRMVRR